MFDSLPSQFCLKDLCAITGRVCELRVNPHQTEADREAREWFYSIGLYDEAQQSKFLNYGKFDLFAALTFPDADLKHLATGIIFFFWAFSTDDWADGGEPGLNSDIVKAAHEISMGVLNDPDGPRPEYPYAAMLYDLMVRFRKTATPGAYRRFIKAFVDWSTAHLQQSKNRFQDRIPPVAEFIPMRRATIGVAQVEAMIEYSIDIDLPDEVFANPIVQAMSDATNDLMTWPNDLCSFNKEQLDGDYQNLVFCVMNERSVGLQEGINIVTDMLSQRVEDYIELKNKLPSFGAGVDKELARYLYALENFVQGTVLWYYLSPRYFRGVDVTNRENLVIPLFQRDLL